MNIRQRIKSTRSLFVVSILGVVLFTIISIGLALFTSELITFDTKTETSELRDAIKNNKKLVAYLEQEKQFESNFIEIANLVIEEKRSELLSKFILYSIPVIIISLLAGYMVAKHLLKPVQEAYEGQEKFIQDAAHELRNPIAAINLALENSISNARGKEEEKLLLDRIDRQAQRLSKINDDLFYLERKSSSSAKAINVSNLLLDVAESMQLSINKKHIHLQCNIEEAIEWPIIKEDFIRLSTNLLDNAIKYNKYNGSVTISLKKDKNLTLLVEDTGIGIPNNDAPKLGMRFFRASNVGDIEGSGLGMAIVNKIITKYKGTIKINSHKNIGTKIIVKL